VGRLNQTIAVVKGKKTQTEKTITEVYHDIKKSVLFEGINRTYEPLDEEGETCPPEVKYPQCKVAESMKTVSDALTDLFNVTATQDWANCRAVADVVVDGKAVLEKVPVTYLLFLEKQLVNVRTFVSSLPTLDPAERWTLDDAVDYYVSANHATNKTKKVPRNHVKAPATDKHPAQVEMYHEDVKVGEWHTVKYSGAMPAKKKNELLDRVTKLQEAVKVAREDANNTEVNGVEVGKPVFEFLFG
jgi:archaellum component FlaF (FlaF/FlaG flagellin family)